ncbi:hypothetical protein [Tepidibacillus marianensis]|uniref:hypothetical protein n=1 Tax=Tepidibacillus marianensis TaxID=3131995 RepID=UPI0030CC4227
MASKTSGSMNISLKGYANLVKELHRINKDSETVIKRTTSDFKSRAPAWVAAAVSQTYGIKKSEITKTKTSAKPVGKVVVSGILVDNVQLTFSGRVLTPTHFNMKPKSRPKPTKDENGKTIRKAKKYTVTAEIFRGQRKALGSNVFLGSNKGTGDIPFQRTGQGRTPIQAIKTLSIPQMITNENVAAQIQKTSTRGSPRGWRTTSSKPWPSRPNRSHTKAPE